MEPKHLLTADAPLIARALGIFVLATAFLTLFAWKARDSEAAG